MIYNHRLCIKHRNSDKRLVMQLYTKIFGRSEVVLYVSSNDRINDFRGISLALIVKSGDDAYSLTRLQISSNIPKLALCFIIISCSWIWNSLFALLFRPDGQTVKLQAWLLSNGMLSSLWLSLSCLSSVLVFARLSCAVWGGTWSPNISHSYSCVVTKSVEDNDSSGFCDWIGHWVAVPFVGPICM